MRVQRGRDGSPIADVGLRVVSAVSATSRRAAIRAAEWRVRRVGIDYHVDVEGHFYSVRYRFARSEVEVRLTGRTVEIFVKGERIAVHMRGSGNGKYTTLADHMPSSHRRYADLDHRPYP